MSVFWRYWASYALSNGGSAVTSVALPLIALYQLEAGPLEVGLIAGSAYIGWALVGLPAGPISQLLPLRRTQISCDALRGLAVATIPAAYFLDVMTIVQLIVVAALVSCCDVLFSVSNSTFLPKLVPAEELVARNSILSGTDSTARLAGPPLAGALVQAAGAPIAILVDALSYLASGVILASLPSRDQPPPKRKQPLRGQIADGWRFVMTDRVMRACLFDATAANFVAGGLLALLPVFVVDELGGAASTFGAVLAAEAAGGFVGAGVATRISRRFGSARTTLGAVVLASVFVMVLAVGSEGFAAYLCLAVGLVGYGAGTTVASINTRTYRQLASPPEMLSRVIATVRFVSWGVIPVGSLVAGLAGEVMGPRAALLAVCLFSWVSPAVLILSPVRGMRHLERPAVVPATIS